MKLFFVFTLPLLLINTLYSQTKLPLIFRVQDKHAKKHIHKYLQHDTLINTSQAVLHINYSIQSSKPILLLLHGMGANGRSNWYNQIKPLSKEFSLIIPDLIYYGESYSNSNDYSVEFQATQIKEAIATLGITQKINVAGFSYGGLTTAVFNDLFHQQVNKMVIIDGPVKFFSAEVADSLAKTVGVTEMKQIIAPATINEFNAMNKAVMSSGFKIGNKMKQKMIKYVFDPFREIRFAQIDYMIQHQDKYQSLNYNLDKTPTLLIWGEKDGVVPSSVGKKLHQFFNSTTQLIIYPNAKHDAHFSYSKELNNAIINFIKY